MAKGGPEISRDAFRSNPFVGERFPEGAVGHIFKFRDKIFIVTFDKVQDKKTESAKRIQPKSMRLIEQKDETSVLVEADRESGKVPIEEQPQGELSVEFLKSMGLDLKSVKGELIGLPSLLTEYLWSVYQLLNHDNQ